MVLTVGFLVKLYCKILNIEAMLLSQ